jgi:hypothetical protein
MAAARTLCQAHEDLAYNMREARREIGEALGNTASILARLEPLTGLPERVTVIEQQVSSIRGSRTRWAGVLPTIVATVASSGITGTVVYLLTRSTS